MGFSARSLALRALSGSLSALTTLVVTATFVLAPAVASAQSGAGAGMPPPRGGAPAAGGTSGGGAAGGGAGAAADEKKPASSGNVGGVSFTDKPAARRAPTARAALRRSGPLATFPGFEQLPDGGSRLFVQLSQSVPVEERRAQGSVTYVLKGAHLRVHNDANALVTVHFNTPVFRARLTPQGNDLLFVLELRAAATPTFKVTENQDKTSTLQIEFAKGDFISGDGSEKLPSEQPAKAPGKGQKRGKRGAQPAPGAPPPPPPSNGDTGDTGDTGPNP
jgi:hypothetical protein